MPLRIRVPLRILVAAALVALTTPVATMAQTVVTVLATLPAEPNALIQATDGNFYGTTTEGGGLCMAVLIEGCGTVFQMTPSGTVTVLHVFTGGADGAYPRGALIQATDGTFYGTTSAGGTVFQITLGGTFTILHTFTAGADGASPGAALIQATDGNFYGTTSQGGGTPSSACPNGCGTVFRMPPAAP